MIYAWDHLSHSVRDIDSAKEKLESSGYKCIFIEHEIENHPAKKKLLSKYQETHGIALFTHQKHDTRIELTSHGQEFYESQSLYQLDSKNQIILAVSDISSEVLFWQNAMRFKEKDGALHFVSPIPKLSISMKLVCAVSVQTPMLDSSGWPCMAFMSNTLDEDLRQAEDAGATDMTDVFALQVAGQSLEVSLFRTPGGALCELIKVNR